LLPFSTSYVAFLRRFSFHVLNLPWLKHV
jgi:hypothetical protein